MDKTQAFIAATWRLALATWAIGVSPVVALCQWALETGWNPTGVPGKTPHPTYNLAGIMGYSGPITYASLGDFIADYLRTMDLAYYAAVRSPGTITEQILRLGESPWDAGHYREGGGEAGSSLLRMLPDVEAALEQLGKGWLLLPPDQWAAAPQLEEIHHQAEQIAGESA